MKAKVILAIRIATLTVLYFLCFSLVSAALLTISSEQPTPTEAGGALVALRDTPMLLPLQAARALMWTALAVLIIRMMKGEWWEAGLAVALSFTVLMNSQLLLPNPLMPQEVRMVHLLETASSNFLFGWLVVFVLLGWQIPGRAQKHERSAG